MKIETLPLEHLIPYASNARTHSESQIQQIAASIREFGFCNPVLIDAGGGIIAGHGRVLAARKLALASAHVLGANGALVLDCHEVSFLRFGATGGAETPPALSFKRPAD
jgi:ParB-like chromosome segregation protein Spo0J